MRHGVATVPGWPRVAMLPAPLVVLAMAADAADTQPDRLLDRVSRLPLPPQPSWAFLELQARVEMPPEEDRAMLFLVGEAMPIMVDSSSESEGDSEEREEGVVPGECINRVPCRLEVLVQVAVPQARMDPARSAQMLTLTLASAVYDVLAETGKMKIPVQRGSGPVFFYKRTQKHTFQIGGRNNRRSGGYYDTEAEALAAAKRVGGTTSHLEWFHLSVHGWLELCRKHLEQENPRRLNGPEGTKAAEDSDLSAQFSAHARSVDVSSAKHPRSTLSSILRPGTVWCGQRGCLDMRGFATASVEERVINSVKKRSGPKEYMKLRVEDLRLETENKSAQQSEALKVLEETEVSLDTKWEDLKFDDLDKVEVLLEVEEEFEHVISDADSDAISSVQGVIDYLQKAQANNTWSLGTLGSSEDDGLYSPKAPSGLACVEETAGGPEAISCIAGDFAARRSAEDLLYAYSAEHQIFFSMAAGHWIIAIWEDRKNWTFLRGGLTVQDTVSFLDLREGSDPSSFLWQAYLLHHTVAAVAFIAAMRMKVRARKEKPLLAAYFQALCSKARPSAVYLYSIFFWREELSKLSTK
ncbi:acpP, partial [Symbiodinium necroappetens]